MTCPPPVDVLGRAWTGLEIFFPFFCATFAHDASKGIYIKGAYFDLFVDVLNHEEKKKGGSPFPEGDVQTFCTPRWASLISHPVVKVKGDSPYNLLRLEIFFVNKNAQGGTK